jgi:hypothetical protein
MSERLLAYDNPTTIRMLGIGDTVNTSKMIYAMAKGVTIIQLNDAGPLGDARGREVIRRMNHR